jgi:hypothetical protein
VRALQPEGAPSGADSPKVVAAVPATVAISLNFRLYLTPAQAVATYDASEKAYEGSHRNSPGEGFVPTLRRTARAVLPFPAPFRHSTVTLLKRVTGEGHNNKDFGP